ncbi:cation acetate symporter [Mycolicibacterium sp. 120270]|uniref:sodium/solute symporter n=1 Tax=Mycolicibacterium sp. 120270 TaxID=3090600 RepID=UPI00299DAC34|nr:cation acetate symporter [Mycolicibacterium sp. 120270]MDX1887257.1 cation acetate symporter [Mycolicibacterium sp. 120270]
MTASPSPALTAAALVAAALATVAVGIYGGRLSRTTSDFLVASRMVGARSNAAAISGEYLSAASFLGVAGLVAKYGADALWYPVGFTAGYLALLLFVAAPLRRSGAYTVPDFTDFRLRSARLRTVTMLFVAVICVLYLVPQYQGAGLTINILLGLPVWVGPVAVAAIIIGNVVGGGMRSITFVQAFQYWLKLTAIAIPALALLVLFFSDPAPLGGPLPPTVPQTTTVAIKTDVVVQVDEPAGLMMSGTLDGRPVADAPIPSKGTHTLGAGSTLTLAPGAATPVVSGAPNTGDEWLGSGGGLGGMHPLYQVLSIIIATFLGAMGLPHVLVRFYTNPDGWAARRTALAVILLLSVFYAFPTLMGVFARLYVPQLLITGTADAAVLLMPEAAIAGAVGRVLGALVAAGAIAAFLATSSGLLVSIAGALATDVLRGRVRDFRIAALIGGLLPLPLALAASTLELSRNVGLVFAVAASTLCPLLVLGIWWRGLTAAGALCGLVVGGALSGGAAGLTLAGGIDEELLGGWPAMLAGYPAAISVPVAFVTMVVASQLTHSSIPTDTARIFARMHLPERLGMSVERTPGD